MLLHDSYIQFLIDKNLTQSQYLLLHLIHNERPDLIRDYKAKFPSDDNTMIGEYYTNDLIKRGFIAYDKANKLYLTDLFLDGFCNKHSVTDEIFKIYPNFAEIQGKMIPLKLMDRIEFSKLYDTAIMSSMYEHREVMKDIEFGIENNLISMGIEKFLKAKYWLSIRPIRIQGKTKETIISKLDNEFNE